MFHPAELFTSVFSAGKSLLWWATTAFISPWPQWLCVIWYAAIWLGRVSRATGLHWLGPITTPLFFSLRYSLPHPLDPSLPLSVLPMNVSISLPMCKLFSPALRADGEQCLCRDFLCMSFLISQRVTRFPCSFLEKGELAWACTHTLHTHTCSHTQSAINMHDVLWGYWCSGSSGRVHYMCSPYNTVMA